MNKKISGKLKNQIVFKMWGRARVKVEETVEKLSQSALFSNFPQNFIPEGNFWLKICNLWHPNHLGTIYTHSLRKPWTNEIFLLF